MGVKGFPTSSDIYLELDIRAPLGDFLRGARQLEMDVSNVQRESVGNGDNAVRCYTATLKFPVRRVHVQMLEQLRNLDGVVWVEEL